MLIVVVVYISYENVHEFQSCAQVVNHALFFVASVLRQNFRVMWPSAGV